MGQCIASAVYATGSDRYDEMDSFPCSAATEYIIVDSFKKT